MFRGKLIEPPKLRTFGSDKNPKARYTEYERELIQRLYGRMKTADGWRDIVSQARAKAFAAEERMAQLHDVKRRRKKPSRRLLAAVDTFDDRNDIFIDAKRAANISLTRSLQTIVRIVTELKELKELKGSIVRKDVQLPDPLPEQIELAALPRTTFYSAISAAYRNLGGLAMFTPEEPVYKFEIRKFWRDLAPESKSEHIRQAIAPITHALELTPFSARAFAPHGRINSDFDWKPRTKIPYPDTVIPYFEMANNRTTQKTAR